MLITVKWLSREVQTVQVEPGIPVYRLIRLITAEPLYRVTIFDEQTIYTHHHRFKEDAVVSILVQDPPATAILVSHCGVGYYYSIYDSVSKKSSQIEEASHFEKVYIDHLSYGVYFDSAIQEKLHQELGISPIGHVDYDDLKLFVYSFLCRNSKEDEAVVRWHDFLKSFNLLLSENIINICFPTLTEYMKRYGLLQPSEWASYFAVKK